MWFGADFSKNVSTNSPWSVDVFALVLSFWQYFMFEIWYIISGLLRATGFCLKSHHSLWKVAEEDPFSSFNRGHYLAIGSVTVDYFESGQYFWNVFKFCA